MSVLHKIRSADYFGAQMQLMFRGQTTSGTLCGGIMSICFTVVIGMYFYERLLDVAVFKDPDISSYTIS